MKKLWLMTTMLAAVMVAAPGAFALSTEQAPVNSDGTAQFSDPDEHTPPGLVSPDSASANVSGGSGGLYMGSPYAPNPSDVSGRDSFDNAYNHVTNSH